MYKKSIFSNVRHMTNKHCKEHNKAIQIMFKAVFAFVLVATATAQVLRISPAIVGSSSPGQQQVIQLGRGGSISSYKPAKSNAKSPQVLQIKPSVRPIAFKPTTFTAPTRNLKPAARQVALPKPISRQITLPKPISQQVSLPKPFSRQVALPKPISRQLSLPKPISRSIALPKPISRQVSLPKPSARQVALPKPISRSIALPKPISRQVSLPKPISQQVSLPKSFSPPVARPQTLASRATSDNEISSKPVPFAFSYDSIDEFGTKVARSESSDGSGSVKGQYTLSDASGLSRTVAYVADAQGFRAEVKTNEPGTLTSNPAQVNIQSLAAPPRK